MGGNDPGNRKVPKECHVDLGLLSWIFCLGSSPSLWENLSLVADLAAWTRHHQHYTETGRPLGASPTETSFFFFFFLLLNILAVAEAVT